MIHGLRDEDVAMQPTWREVGQNFLSWMSSFGGKELVLVSHGATDYNWLKAEYERNEMEIPSTWKFMDSCQLMRHLLNTQKVGLENLAKRFQVIRKESHRAIADIWYTWKFVQLAVEEKLPGSDPYRVFLDFAFEQRLPALPHAARSIHSAATSTQPSQMRGSYKCRTCGQPKKGHRCPLETQVMQTVINHQPQIMQTTINRDQPLG
jgi:DNA polymerase III epsilon subunit-like protein